MFWVSVVLNVEPLPQLEVMSALEALVGPFKDIYRYVLNPFLCFSSVIESLFTNER